MHAVLHVTGDFLRVFVQRIHLGHQRIGLSFYWDSVEKRHLQYNTLFPPPLPDHERDLSTTVPTLPDRRQGRELISLSAPPTRELHLSSLAAHFGWFVGVNMLITYLVSSCRLPIVCLGPVYLYACRRVPIDQSGPTSAPSSLTSVLGDLRSLYCY